MSLALVLTPALAYSGAPGVPQLPLDNYTLNLWAATSIRKLLTSYSGACIRVRRSSDNSEQDIGFSGDQLDVASLLTFAGSGSAFVRTVYDQSGTGNNIIQTAQSNQPRIVNSGVFDGQIIFDASNDYFVSENTSGTPTALICYLGGTLRSSATDQIIMEHGSNWAVGSGNNMIAACNSSGGTEVGMSELGVGNRSLGIFNGIVPNDNISTYAYDRTKPTYDTCVTFFVNGVKQTRSSSNNAAFKPSGNFTNDFINIGARAGGTIASSMNMTDMIIYNAGQDDSLITSVATSLI